MHDEHAYGAFVSSVLSSGSLPRQRKSQGESARPGRTDRRGAELARGVVLGASVTARAVLPATAEVLAGTGEFSGGARMARVLMVAPRPAVFRGVTRALRARGVGVEGVRTVVGVAPGELRGYAAVVLPQGSSPRQRHDVERELARSGARARLVEAELGLPSVALAQVEEALTEGEFALRGVRCKGERVRLLAVAPCRVELSAHRHGGFARRGEERLGAPLWVQPGEQHVELTPGMLRCRYLVARAGEAVRVAVLPGRTG